jgi:hypothetical protein
MKTAEEAAKDFIEYWKDDFRLAPLADLLTAFAEERVKAHDFNSPAMKKPEELALSIVARVLADGISEGLSEETNHKIAQAITGYAEERVKQAIRAAVNTFSLTKQEIDRVYFEARAEALRDLKLACPLCGETLDHENNVKNKWLEEAARMSETHHKKFHFKTKPRDCVCENQIADDIRALKDRP